MSKRFLFLSCALLLPAIAQGALSVQLSITPVHTLPGLPVSFEITINNPDPTAKMLPTGGILIVTPAGGEPWLAHPLGPYLVENLAEFMLGTTAIQPHGHYTFDIPLAATLASPSWFTDRRLNVPGIYRLQFVLSDVPPEKLWRLSPTSLAAVAPNSVLSNEVILTIDTPTGEDAAVWRLLLNRDPNGVRAGAWPPDLAKQILREHPKSTYSRYVVVAVAVDTIENQIKAIEEALVASPNDPFADVQKFRIAALEEYLYGDAHGHGRDASILKQHAQRAVTTYRTVVKTAHSAFYRSLAQNKLDDMLIYLEDDGVDVQ